MKKIIKIVEDYLIHFAELCFPEFCVACGKNLVGQEKVLCTKCLYHIPRTNFHKIPGNPVEQSFWGRQPVEHGTSYFFFQKGSKYQEMLHELKYKGRQDIGIELGRHFAADLLNYPEFSSVDFLIPVPLHPKKQKKRGYNQSECIAKGMADILPGKVNTNVLFRKQFTNTQTKKNRYERWENVQEVFECKNPNVIANKHLLIIDDVMTTGATLEGCIQVLHEAAPVKISVATLAYAKI